MLNFVEPAPLFPVIDIAQQAWPIWARLSAANLQVHILEHASTSFFKLGTNRVLICANHAAHEDPLVLFAMGRQLKEHFAYVTARELFKRYPSPSALWLQWLGCYSVVRSAPDLASFKATVKLLESNRAKVVIFPEGEITHQNMQVMELENGPEHLALTAAKGLQESGDNSSEGPGSVFVLPVGLLYRFADSHAESVGTILQKLENELTIVTRRCMCVPHRLYDCYSKMLRMMCEKAGVQFSAGSSLKELRDALLRTNIETIGRTLNAQLPSRMNAVEKIHVLRNQFNELRFGSRRGSKISPQRRRLYRLLKTATNIFAIADKTFDHSMSQEEVAEVLCIVEYELFREISIKGQKICHVDFAAPLNANSYMDTFKKDKHVAINELKADLRDAIAITVAGLAEAFPSRSVYPICGSNYRISHPPDTATQP